MMRPVSPEIHAQFLRNLEDLAHSGHKWAHESLRTDASLYIYYSAAGFTAAFEALARQDTRIHLVGLKEMYGR